MRLWWVALFLIGINLLVYAPLTHYDFVNYDDPQYVAQNPHVAGGLSWSAVVWAFTTGTESNWHPLTWLSHMVDVHLYGLNPGPHHVTNLLLHIANTLLLFWAVLKMSGAPAPSVFMAALFAVHPLHVESVAWIAERKDVLSTFFWMSALVAYASYARQPRVTKYVVVVLLFAAGLMAKPMVVTLPFVLLLLDFWPLGRLNFASWSNVSRLIVEKVPLLILTIVSSVITMIAQQRGGAMMTLQTFPFSVRLANAAIAYLTYVGKMFWPSRLAVFYPLGPIVPGWWLAAVFILIALSFLSVLVARRWPYLTVGWLWFFGTLVPVIGLVQVGGQAVADRYTYVPLLGLFLI